MLSLYIHIPFCRQRCNYCDFNTYAGQDAFIPEYVRTLCLEIKQMGHYCQEPVHTIYFGGGTPSILPINAYERVMAEIVQDFNLSPDMEISMEVNPGTIQSGFFEGIRNLGVNRLSIGMQSGRTDELALLGRIHSPWNVIETIRVARLAGFDNLSLDLMFGLPGQTLASWQDSLDFALRLDTPHLSLYSLTYEKGTRLEGWQRKGLLPLMPEDLSADMYEYTMKMLSKNGYIHYEISNWAKGQGETGRDYSCCHNRQYWLNLPYIGIGAGAHSYYGGFRWENIRTIASYIQAGINNDDKKKPFAQIKKKRPDMKTEMQETMFMGLRLLQQGISNLSFKMRFGMEILDAFPKEINELEALGLVMWHGIEKKNLCLTRRGCLLGNQVFMRFVN
jgi:oxygen-independent coproporphyrinogen III oxidase